MTDRSLIETALRLARRHVLALSIAALLLVLGMLTDEVLEGDTLAFDKTILLLLRSGGDPAKPIGPPWLIEVVRDVTALGGYTVLTLLVGGAVLSLLFMRRRRTAVFIAGAVSGGAALSTLLKVIVDRPRPELTGVAAVFTPSFPSGHATASAVAYLTLGACLTRTTGDARLKAFYVAYAALLTLIVGLSRLYLGVHYPTDVLAGWALGTSWALFCWVAMEAWLGGSPKTGPEHP